MFSIQTDLCFMPDTSGYYATIFFFKFAILANINFLLNGLHYMFMSHLFLVELRTSKGPPLLSFGSRQETQCNKRKLMLCNTTVRNSSKVITDPAAPFRNCVQAVSNLIHVLKKTTKKQSKQKCPPPASPPQPHTHTTEEFNHVCHHSKSERN